MAAGAERQARRCNTASTADQLTALTGERASSEANRAALAVAMQAHDTVARPTRQRIHGRRHRCLVVGRDVPDN
jgi:hypothetical protein